MRLVERAVGEDVVEHHRDAQRADLDRVRRAVRDLEAQRELAVHHAPAAKHLQRDVRRQRRREVGLGQHAGRDRARRDRRAGGRRGIRGPVTGSRATHPQVQVAEVDEAVLGTGGQPVAGREVERGFGER